MTKNTIKGIVGIALAVSVAAPASVYATNGLFLIGSGNKSRAMGGVGIAVALDSLSAAANPATIAGMKDRFDIGMDIFRPQVESQLGSITDKSVASINGVGMDSVFFMPAMAITYQLNDKMTLGFTMAAAGGGGTKFEKNFFEAARVGDLTGNAPETNAKNLGVDLAFMEMAPTIAYKINKTHSVGVSLLIGVARFEAQGIDLFAPFTPSNTANNLSEQGKDWSFGAGMRVGWTGNFGDITLGAQYTSKIWMQNFDHYSELFAEAGSFDIPSRLGLGISMQATPKLLVAFDITKTFYERVNSVSNLGPNIPPGNALPGPENELGLSQGLGFGWEDQIVYKIGAAFTLSEKIILRGGWNYGKSPINEDREIIFNLLAPATTEHHVTMGGTYLLNPTMEINVSYIHAFKNEQSGPTYISNDGSNFGRFEMSQDVVGGSFSMQY